MAEQGEVRSFREDPSRAKRTIPPGEFARRISKQGVGSFMWVSTSMRGAKRIVAEQTEDGSLFWSVEPTMDDRLVLVPVVPGDLAFDPAEYLRKFTAILGSQAHRNEVCLLIDVVYQRLTGT